MVRGETCDAVKVVQRIVIGVAIERRFRSVSAIVDGALGKAAFFEMLGKLRMVVREIVAVALLDIVRDLAVELVAPAARDQAMGHFPDEHVVEFVGVLSRARALVRFIEYIKSRERVWICGREDIARHWISQHPPG